MNINEMFLVEVAHFPADRFRVKAIGTYPGLILTFPWDDKDFDKRCEETRRIFETGKLDYSAAFMSSEVKIIAPTKTKKGKDT